ncbi:MAG: IS110 family transposase [Verrucomicrobiota bacterium]
MKTDTHIAPQEPVYCGIDLHSNNLVLVVMDQQGHRQAQTRVVCELEKVLGFLDPWKSRLKRVAVESTYNWYWLVDGLDDRGYPIDVVNPAQFSPYQGLKHSDDMSDASFIADMLRLGVLPVGYQYSREERPVRDLLRRRTLLVRQRTSQYLSLKSLHSRNYGKSVRLSELKRWDPQKAGEIFPNRADQLLVTQQLLLVQQLSQGIRAIEKEVLSVAKLRPEFDRLKSVPGVGVILGMTLLMEIGQIQRFSSPEKLASYARCVPAPRVSNGKSKGQNNRKWGNRYLGWALVEAAHCAIRSDGPAQRYYQRKVAQTNPSVATKALACKLCKAVWHVWNDQTGYDPVRVFGPQPQSTSGRAVGSQQRECPSGTDLIGSCSPST